MDCSYKLIHKLWYLFKVWRLMGVNIYRLFSEPSTKLADISYCNVI